MELKAISKKPAVQSINGFIGWLAANHPSIYTDCYVRVDRPVILWTDGTRNRWLHITWIGGMWIGGWRVELGCLGSCRSRSWLFDSLDPDQLLCLLTEGELHVDTNK